METIDTEPPLVLFEPKGVAVAAVWALAAMPQPIPRTGMSRELALLHRLTTRHACHALEAVSTPAVTDPVVMRAYRLLERLEPTQCPSLDDVHVGPGPGEGACYRGLIVVDPRREFYRAAQRGDLLRLAMLLHHEAWHSRNGSR